MLQFQLTLGQNLEKEIEVVVWPEAWKSFQSELQSGKTLVLEGILETDEKDSLILTNIV